MHSGVPGGLTVGGGVPTVGTKARPPSLFVRPRPPAIRAQGSDGRNITKVITMKITLKTTATQVAKELDKLSAAGDSAQWAKRSIIAEVSEVHGWSTDDLHKGGSGAAFLAQVGDKARSKAQMSELRSYANPLVRGKVPAIRQHAEALSEREDFKGQRAGNIANLLVTQIKGGKSVPDAVDQVTQDRTKKNAAREELKAEVNVPEGDLVQFTSALGAHQPQVVPQDLQQRMIRGDKYFMDVAIYVQFDGTFHYLDLLMDWLKTSLSKSPISLRL